MRLLAAATICCLLVICSPATIELVELFESFECAPSH